MANYLCSVSGRFPENYDIGVRTNLWGVEEKYKDRIKDVKPGDLLIFVVGGEVRSIHTIESRPFYDETPLWPEKDGSLFPHRIKISSPWMKGKIPLKEIAEEISFMKGKVFPGTIQGPNGVFNNKLTDADIKIIKQRMNTGEASPKVVNPIEIIKASERQTALFKFYEKDIEDHISQILPKMGLKLFKDAKKGVSGRQFSTDVGRMDLLCINEVSGHFVVVELKKGEAPDQALLQILRYMSWVRQNLANGKDVEGIILTESADKSLVQVIGEVKNVQIRYYKVALELI